MLRQTGAGIGQNQMGFIPITLTDLATGGTPPDLVTVDQIHCYSYDITDDSDFTFTVPADYLTGTTMTVVVDWAINEVVGVGVEVNWRNAWESHATDSTQVIGTGTGGTVDSGDIVIPTLARQLTTMSLIIDAADLAALDLVRCIFSRIAIVGGTDPTADPEVYAITVQYTKTWPYYRR